MLHYKATDEDLRNYPRSLLPHERYVFRDMPDIIAAEDDNGRLSLMKRTLGDETWNGLLEMMNDLRTPDERE